METATELRVGTGLPGPGRPAGVPNKINLEVRAMISEALERAGGADYLLERALDPNTQGAFLALVGKILPKDVQLSGEIRVGLAAMVQASLSITPERVAEIRAALERAAVEGAREVKQIETTTENAT